MATGRSTRPHRFAPNNATPTRTTAVISETIRQELGPNALTEIFDFIDPVPLASASIAQVHIGKLKTGEEVAIKVLKPEVEGTLKADLGFLFLASRLVETLAPEARRASLGEIVGDIRTAIQDEVGDGDCLLSHTHTHTGRARLGRPSSDMYKPTHS